MAKRSTITLSKSTFDRFNSAASGFKNGSYNTTGNSSDQGSPFGGKNFFYGKIVNEGPESEINYTADSNLYWVKKLYVNDSATILEDTTLETNESINTVHITATDITNSSRLAVDTIVQVYWEVNQLGYTKHIILGSIAKLIKAIVLSEQVNTITCYIEGSDSSSDSFFVNKPIHLQGGISKIADKYIYPPYCNGNFIYIQTITPEGTDPDIIKYVDAHARDLDDCPSFCQSEAIKRYTKSCATDENVADFADCPSAIYFKSGSETWPEKIQATIGESCCEQTCCYALSADVIDVDPTCPVPIWHSISDCEDCSDSKCGLLVDCCDEDNYRVVTWKSLSVGEIVSQHGTILGKVAKEGINSQTCWQIPTAPITQEELDGDAELASFCETAIAFGIQGHQIVVSDSCNDCLPAYAELTNCDELITQKYYVEWEEWVVANSLAENSIVKLASPYQGCFTVGTKTLGCMPETILNYAVPTIMGTPYESCELCDVKCAKLTECGLGGGQITVDWQDVSTYASRIVKFGGSPTCWQVPANHSNTCNIADIISLTTAGGNPVDAGAICDDCIQDTVTLVDCSDPLNEYIIYWDWVKNYASKIIKIDNTGSGCESTCWQVPADHDEVAGTVDEFITTVFESYDDCESCADVYNLTLCPINGISTGLTIVVKALGLSNLIGKTVKLSNGMCYSVISINEAVDPAVICEVISEIHDECLECSPTPLCIDECSISNTALGVGVGSSQAIAEAAAIASAKANAATSCGSSGNIDFCSCGTILESYESTSEWQSIAYVCYSCVCSSSNNLANAVIGRTGPAVYIEEVDIATACDTVIPNHPDYVDCVEGFYATSTGEYISNVELEMQEYADGATIVPSAGYTNSGQTGDYVASISGSCVFDDVSITGTIKFSALNMKLSKKKSCFVYNTGKTCILPTGQCNGTTVC